MERVQSYLPVTNLLPAVPDNLLGSAITSAIVPNILFSLVLESVKSNMLAKL